MREIIFFLYLTANNSPAKLTFACINQNDSSSVFFLQNEMRISKIQDDVTKVDYIQQYLDGTVKIKFDNNKTKIPLVIT